MFGKRWPVTSRLQFLKSQPVDQRSLRYAGVHHRGLVRHCLNALRRGSEGSRASRSELGGLHEFALRNDGVTGSNPVCGTSLLAKSDAEDTDRRNALSI